MNLVSQSHGTRATAVAPFPRDYRECQLGFARAPDGSTFIAGQRSPYPFHLCKGFRYDGDPPGMLTVYMQSASGGIYAGERLGTKILVEDGAAAHVTAQASTIVHEMREEHASHAVALTAGPGAVLEYLPEAVILFPGSQLRSTVKVVVHDDAAMILSDSFLCHDPAGLGRRFGMLTTQLDVTDPGGRLLARDRYAIAGETLDRMVPRPGGCLGHGTVTMLAGRDVVRQGIGPVRQALSDLMARHDASYGGASTLPGERGIWARFLAREGAALRSITQGVWARMRESLTGRPPVARRK